jgi:hypothetical protein
MDTAVEEMTATAEAKDRAAEVLTSDMEAKERAVEELVARVETLTGEKEGLTGAEYFLVEYPY